METCVPYLRAQIDVIKPTAMVALGATAVEGLLGPVGTIGTLRGKFLEYRNTPLMPTYHPSYLLRNQSNTEKRKVWEDLLKVMERLEMPITDKQRGFLPKGLMIRLTLFSLRSCRAFVRAADPARRRSGDETASAITTGNGRRSWLRGF